MSLRQTPSALPPFPFEAYSHVLGPISAEDGGGYQFSMPDFPGLLADGRTEIEAIADGREAFLAVVSALVDQGHPFRRLSSRSRISRRSPRPAAC